MKPRLAIPVVVVVVLFAVAVGIASSSMWDDSRLEFEACEIRGYEVFCVDLESGARVVSPSQPDNGTTQIVVIDPGGPGADIRGYFSTLFEIESLEPNTQVVAFLEPWFVQALSDDCKSAASLLLSDMRDSNMVFSDAISEHASGFASGCAAEVAAAKEFAAERARFLSDLRHEIAKRSEQDVRLVFVGWSFASVRAAQLVGHASGGVDAAVFVSPIDPVASVEATLTSRSSKIEKSISQALDEWCGERLAFPCGVEFSGIFDELARFLPLQVEERSVPLTEFDVAAAVYGASYSLDANAGWLFDGLVGVSESVSDSRTLQLASAADSVLGRYGVDGVYPGVVGYWSEFCSAMSSGGQFRAALADGSRSGFEQALFVLHSPCGAIESSPVVTAKGIDRVCVLIDPDDPLTVDSDDVPRLWGTSAEVLVFEGSGHSIGLMDAGVLSAIESIISRTEDAEGCDIQ